jgi:hypothetical protein
MPNARAECFCLSKSSNSTQRLDVEAALQRKVRYTGFIFTSVNVFIPQDIEIVHY